MQKETNWWYSLVIDVKCSWHTVADNMFSIINMIIIIIWQYSTYSCECVKRLFISLIKANCICSLFDWGRAGLGCWWQQRKEGTGSGSRGKHDTELESRAPGYIFITTSETCIVIYHFFCIPTNVFMPVGQYLYKLYIIWKC